MSLIRLIGVLLVAFGAWEIYLGALFFGIVVILVGLFVAGYLGL